MSTKTNKAKKISEEKTQVSEAEIRSSETRRKSIEQFITGVLPSNLSAKIGVKLTPNIPTACVLPTNEDDLIQSEQTDIDRKQAEQLVESTDKDYLVYITTRPADLNQTVLDDQTTADYRRQFGYALHETLHIFKTSFKGVNELIQSDIDEENQDTLHELHNIIEDGAIENELITGNEFTDRSAGWIRFVRDLQATSPEEEFKKNGEKPIKCNFSKALETVFYETFIFKSGAKEALLDEDDHRIQFEDEQVKEIIEKITPEIEQARDDIFEIRSDLTDYQVDRTQSLKRTQRLLTLWKDHIKPHLDSTDSSQNQSQQNNQSSHQQSKQDQQQSDQSQQEQAGQGGQTPQPQNNNQQGDQDNPDTPQPEAKNSDGETEGEKTSVKVDPDEFDLNDLPSTKNREDVGEAPSPEDVDLNDTTPNEEDSESNDQDNTDTTEDTENGSEGSQSEESPENKQSQRDEGKPQPENIEGSNQEDSTQSTQDQSTPADEAGSESKDESNQDEGQSGSQSEGQSGSQSEGQSGSQSEGQSGSQSEGQSGSQSKGQSGSQSEGQSGSQSEGQSGSQSEGQSGSQSEGQSGSQSEGQSGSQSSDTNTESSSKPQPDSNNKEDSSDGQISLDDFLDDSQKDDYDANEDENTTQSENNPTQQPNTPDEETGEGDSTQIDSESNDGQEERQSSTVENKSRESDESDGDNTKAGDEDDNVEAQERKNKHEETNHESREKERDDASTDEDERIDLTEDDETSPPTESQTDQTPNTQRDPTQPEKKPAHEKAEMDKNNVQKDRSEAEKQKNQSTPNSKELEKDLNEIDNNANGAGKSTLDRLKILPDPVREPISDWNKVQQDSRRVANLLQKQLDISQRDGKISGLTAGSNVDPSKLYRLQNGDPRVMEETYEGDQKEYFFVLVLDRSSSMGSKIRSSSKIGEKIKTAVQAVTRFATACEKIGIKTAIIDFYDNECRYIKPPSVPVKHSLDRLLSPEASGGTPLTDAYEIAQDIAFDHKRKSMVVSITDDQDPEVEETKKVIRSSPVPICSLTIATDETNHTPPQKAKELAKEYTQSAYIYEEENLSNRLDEFAALVGYF